MSETTNPSPSVSGEKLHAFEAILRMCARTAPQPWYPRVYAQSVGMSQDSLYRYLEDLWLDGLVRKAEGSPETGPGLTLTEAGRDVLGDPAALERLKEGRPVKPGDQGGAVREAFRRRTRPIATLGVIAVNAAAFLYTVYLASRLGIVSDFIALSPFGGANPVVAQRVQNLIIQAGAVYGGGWLKGEWWLLLTSCFIHIGAMHILANMYALYRVGGEVERMWGSARYLVIYLFAGLGGSCLALGLAPRDAMAGASGAICGVLGAEAAWVLCNGQHLPRLLARELRRNLLINGVLITFISLMPGVSWQGHLGGALTGAAVALVMQVQRFGPSFFRWAVLLVLVPLPWAGLAFIQYERATNPEWARAALGQADDDRSQEEITAFQSSYLKRIQNETRAALKVYENAGVLDIAPEDRNPAEVAKVKHNLGEQREIVKQLAVDLTAAGPYKNRDAENARQKALVLAEAVEDLLTTAEKRLREGEEWTAADQTKSDKVKEAVTEWRKLLR